MQCHLIITLALAGAIGTNATAQELQPITVHEMHITDCTPPASFAVCDTWHAQIRRSFSPREIGMLFGARSAYAEYRTSFASVEDRYNHLLATFAANNDVPAEALAGR